MRVDAIYHFGMLIGGPSNRAGRVWEKKRCAVDAGVGDIPRCAIGTRRSWSAGRSACMFPLACVLDQIPTCASQAATPRCFVAPTRICKRRKLATGGARPPSDPATCAHATIETPPRARARARCARTTRLRRATPPTSPRRVPDS